MRRVALLGGSFNPPHVGHLLLALYVLETQPIDELWFLPTYRHAFGKALAPYADRVAMCELLAAAAGPRVQVSHLERDLAERPGFVDSRTITVLETLAIEQPTVAPRLVIGTDILAETSKWLRWHDVVRLAPPIVVGREGIALQPGAVTTELTMPAVSSTEVRARLAAGDSVAGLLPRAVIGYIAAHGMYTS